MTRYPAETDDVAERGRAFLSVIGSFWLELHKDKRLFARYASGLGEYLAQALVDVLYTSRTLARNYMPERRPFHWRRVSFRQSDLENSEAGDMKYGGDYVYGVSEENFTIKLYGDRDDSSIQKLGVDSTFVHASVLTDTPVEPSVVLACGTSFWFDTDTSSLQFRSDPFSIDGMPVVEITDGDGEVTDREITLWAFDCEYDVQDMSNRFGVVVGLISTSSEEYSKLVNMAIDMLVGGPAMSAFRSFMAAWAGERPVQSDGEVVTDVVDVAGEWVVATDQNVYTFSNEATPVVEVGDVLNQGDMLSDAVQILDQIYELEDLEGLPLDSRWCAALGRDVLGFGNEDMPIVLETVSDKTKISAEIHGGSRAVREFWERVHTAGVASGTTLADSLDLRDSPTTEPELKDLPKTINPLRLLLSEMQGALLVVKVKPWAFSSGAPNVALGNLVRRLLPPRLTCLLLIETPVTIEYFGLDEPASSEPGASDGMSLGLALGNAFYESIPVGDFGSLPGVFDVGPIIWTTGAPCPAE